MVLNGVKYSRIASSSLPDCLIRQLTINDIHGFTLTASVFLTTIGIESERITEQRSREIDDSIVIYRCNGSTESESTDRTVLMRIM